ATQRGPEDVNLLLLLLLLLHVPFVEPNAPAIVVKSTIEEERLAPSTSLLLRRHDDAPPRRPEPGDHGEGPTGAQREPRHAAPGHPAGQRNTAREVKPGSAPAGSDWAVSHASLQVRDMIVTRPDIGFLRTDDDFILRFLRARKFEQAETFRLLAQYFQFRQQNLD
uniref:CRAL/TRIO N-terminal domain-containing protein n=1 Tax=Gasterosteus aculeatus aculeatus TaxID=481459 RepID=A0AAQ4PMJ3_GASAC